MESLVFLTYLGTVLLIGIICTVIAKKINISNVLLLILAGMILNRVSYQGNPLIQFPVEFLTSISILALVMIVFDSSSRFKMGDFNQISSHALRLTGVFLILNLVFLTFFVLLIFGTGFNAISILLALLFSALMSGTDPAAVISMLNKTKHKIVDILQIESLLNTPLVVLLPFIIIELINRIVTTQNPLFSGLFDHIFPFLKGFILVLIAGIGAGVIVAILVSKLMKDNYSGVLSPLSLITAALLTYILAENFGGNGVLAVTTFGLLFGNMYVVQKIQLMEFSSIFATALEILVFILVGLMVTVPLTFNFVFTSFILFVIYIGIRYASIQIAFRRNNLSIKEKIFMACNVQKGIAVAVVVFTLSILNIEGIDIILNLTLMFMLYSILLSTVILKLTHYFLKQPKKNDH